MMERPIKDEDSGISGWESTSPCKSPRCAERNMRKKPQAVYKTIVLPYGPRNIQLKVAEKTKNKTVLHNVVIEIPVINGGFPKRSMNLPNKKAKKSFIRSSSCTSEPISIFDIENIERIQKLLPYRPLMTSKPQGKPRNKYSTSLSTPNESQKILGAIKETACIHAYYRKYIKEKQL